MPVLLSAASWDAARVDLRDWLREQLIQRLPGTRRRFLEDAHRLGILRQVGAVYRFRHARLQEHLARRG